MAPPYLVPELVVSCSRRVRRADENDARIRRVYLTRAGHRMLSQIRRELERNGTRILRSNTDEEVATTIRVLHRMKENLLSTIGEADAGAEPEEEAGPMRDD